MQKVAEDALVGKRGAVVALDPKTGDVIALASTPGLSIPTISSKGCRWAQYSSLVE